MKIKVTEYVHAHNDEFADWEMELGEEYRQCKAARELHYRLLELAVDLEIDTETGKYEILEIRDGDTTLRPV